MKVLPFFSQAKNVMEINEVSCKNYSAAKKIGIS